MLLSAAVGDAVNTHYQYLPRVADVVNVPTWPTASARTVAAASRTYMPHTTKPADGHYGRGAVVEVELPGLQSGFGSHHALVYVPPQYFTQPLRHFPVVYLIHGSPGAPARPGCGRCGNPCRA